MPVRIYDLAKKLGIESKEVLAEAKKLGIAQAKVPSSSLDKITAEFLEQQLAALFPQHKTPKQAPSPAAVPAVPETLPVAPLLSEPPKEAAAVAALPPEPVVELAPLPVAPVVVAAPQVIEPEPPPPSPPPPLIEPPKIVLPPAVPPPPKVGDKVGFVQLPVKPAARPQPDRMASRATAGAGATTGRSTYPGRGESQNVRGGAVAPSGPAPAGQRFAPRTLQKAPAPAPAGGKPAEKFVPLATGQVITLKHPSSSAIWPSNSNASPFRSSPI